MLIAGATRNSSTKDANSWILKTMIKFNIFKKEMADNKIFDYLGKRHFLLFKVNPLQMAADWLEKTFHTINILLF